jgi:hypothetical protein
MEIADAATAAGIWRDTDGVAELSPPSASLFSDYILLRKAIVELYLLEPSLFKTPVEDSADIKRIIFTHPRFETGFENILFLLMHCLVKSSNECVCEGVGSIVNRYADPRRGSIAADSRSQISGPEI